MPLRDLTASSTKSKLDYQGLVIYKAYGSVTGQKGVNHSVITEKHRIQIRDLSHMYIIGAIIYKHYYQKASFKATAPSR